MLGEKNTEQDLGVDHVQSEVFDFRMVHYYYYFFFNKSLAFK